MKLIDKDAVVAAIDTIMKKQMNFHKIACINGHKGESCSSMIYAQLEELLSFINTLEVKEVDLEKEINEYICNNFFGSQTLGFFANRTKEEPNDQDMALCAKHFFELGLKAQKGE